MGFNLALAFALVAVAMGSSSTTTTTTAEPDDLAFVSGGLAGATPSQTAGVAATSTHAFIGARAYSKPPPPARQVPPEENAEVVLRCRCHAHLLFPFFFPACPSACSSVPSQRHKSIGARAKTRTPPSAVDVADGLFCDDIVLLFRSDWRVAVCGVTTLLLAAVVVIVRQRSTMRATIAR